MQKLQGVKDKIVVEMVKIEQKTEGGLFIPEGFNQLPQSYGTVISLGKEVQEINEGDLIMFHQRAGMDTLIDNKIYKVLMYSEVYAVVKE
jgi:co-chaperonin GroES (HSP10)